MTKGKVYNTELLVKAANPDIRNKTLKGLLTGNHDGSKTVFQEEDVKHSDNPIIYEGDVIRVRMQKNGVCRGTFMIAAGVKCETLVKDAAAAAEKIAESGTFYKKYYGRKKGGK